MRTQMRLAPAVSRVAGALILGAVFLGASSQSFAQPAQQAQQFRASITGNPNDTRGKCTIEVVVDIAVEIEISGDSAVMRNFGGQPARWVRFQCNAPMPLVPLNFRFSGVDGRGRQTLLRPPVNGDPAVVRIEDPQGGTEGYTFDLEWNGAGSGNVGQNRGGQQGGGFGGGPGRDDRDRGRDFNRRLTADDAIRTCEDAIIDQALDRLRVAAIVIRRTSIDEGTGRREWVIGNFETRLGPGGGRDRDMYRFQCSVNFENGRVRSADFQPGQ